MGKYLCLSLAIVLIFAASIFSPALAGERTYPVTVDYSMSLANMVAAGQYDWKDQDISAKNFPIYNDTGKKEVVIEPTRFGYAITSEDAIRELDKMGLRPATLPELLAFGAKYPEVQREFMVIALGSLSLDRFGDRRVPSLWGNTIGRGLRLYWFEGGWPGSCRFAAVRLPAQTGK